MKFSGNFLLHEAAVQYFSRSRGARQKLEKQLERDTFLGKTM